MKKAFCSAALSLGLAVLSHGAVMIDNFNGPLNLNIPALGGNPSGVSGGNSHASILGGSRGISFSRTAGNGAESLNVDLGGTGILEFASGSFDTVTAFMQWDGDTNPNSLNASGLGGFDLSQGGANNRLVITQHADRPTNLTNFGAITITLYSGAGNASSLTMQTINTAFLGPFIEIEFPFAAFVATQGAGANLANIGAIELSINGNNAPGLDLAFDFLEARSIPEPATLLLVGAALVGAGLLRRRRTT